MTYQDNTVELPLELRPQYVVEQPIGSGVFVRLNDSFLRCVVYLGWPIAGSDDQLDPVGTGFIVAHDLATYIVTAAHVALEFSRDGVPFGIRMNKSADGSGKVIHIDSAKWYFHPDDKIDVAVLPFMPPSWAKANAFPTTNVISDYKAQTKDIGPGDLAYVVGIFKLLPGLKKNNPVVHVGHVASMAHGEDIETQDWRSTAKNPPPLNINGYIIQVHTMPQSSGSPVFVRRSLLGHSSMSEKGHPAEPVERMPQLVTAMYGSVWLLGLWHGAWTDDIAKYLSIAKDTVTLGMGMGITIPAPRIIETLNQPELKAMRKAAVEVMEAQWSAPKVVPQSANTMKQGDDILRAALNTPPPRKPKRKAKASRAKVSSK